jgi:hypothetical protein
MAKAKAGQNHWPASNHHLLNKKQDGKMVVVP